MKYYLHLGIISLFFFTTKSYVLQLAFPTHENITLVAAVGSGES